MAKKKLTPKDVRLVIRLSRTTAAAIATRAKNEDQTTAEWARNKITAAVEFSPDLMILLTEVAATRLETRMLLREQIQGQLSAERFRELMEDTDKKKAGFAQKLLAKARQASDTLPATGGNQ